MAGLYGMVFSGFGVWKRRQYAAFLAWSILTALYMFFVRYHNTF